MIRFRPSRNLTTMSCLNSVLVFIIFISVLTFATSRGYGASTLHFDPNGRIQQIEFARNAAAKGKPVMGICCRNGCILVSALGNEEDSTETELLSEGGKGRSVSEQGEIKEETLSLAIDTPQKVFIAGPQGSDGICVASCGLL